RIFFFFFSFLFVSSCFVSSRLLRHIRRIDTDDGLRLPRLSRRLLRIFICYRYLREGLFVKASKSDDGFCSAPSITESDEKPKPIYWKSHESNTLSFTPPRSFIRLSYQDLQY
ncbi:unnamed protein product, partial [Brassica oleracea var. botrytis]